MISKDFQKELLKQLITLSTSGFGLVAALAWNEAIQTFVKQYVDTYISIGSGVVYRFIYAIIITTIAVLVTYQLTKLARLKDDRDKSK